MRAIATALGLLVLPAVALAQDEKPGDQERGRQIAEKSCAGCHAIGPDGGSSKVAKATPFKALAENSDASHQRLLGRLDDLGLLDQPKTASGHPPVPGVDRQQMRDVIAYMRSLVVPEAG
jgi:mono/diheme cytochrome c family protein